MTGKEYNLFLISEALKGFERRPIITFISKNYDTAKLYFKSWLYDKKNPEKLYLHQIGKFKNGIEIEYCNIFVSGGYEELFRREREFKAYEEKQRILNASKQKTEKEIIKALFDGKEIEDRIIKID